MSRLTFRDKATSVAWQKQLRDRYLDEGIPPVPHLDVGKAIVKPVSRKLAKQIILKYEWLGTITQTGYHYGIFFGLFCAGVCCYAAGGGFAGANAHKEFGIQSDELCILTRGANVHWSPKGANSKLVSWASKLLKRDYPKGRLVIAYSDTDAGEIGTIYQACNWIYIGKGKPTKQFIAPNGRIYDQKIVYDTRNRHNMLKTVSWSDQCKALIDNGWIQQSSNPKHKYVYILDKRDKPLIRRVEAMRQPYPKRADS